MGDSIWFWEKDGERHGPASEAEITAMIESGGIQGKTLVWKDGMQDWQPLADTDLHQEVKPSGPPQIPSSQAPAATGAFPPIKPPVEAPIRKVKFRESFQPRFRSSLGRAWELFKTDFWVFVGMSALMGILIGVAAQLYVTILFLIYPLMAGLNWYILNRVRGIPTTIDALFFGFKRRFSDLALLNLVLVTPFMVIFFLLFAGFIALAFMGATSLESSGSMSEEWIAVGFIGGTCLATLLFMIPYFAITAVANFAMLLILDCDLSWKPAIGMAWKVVKKHLFKFMAMMFLFSLIAQLGVIALYFGVFITAAWATIAMVYLYEDAFGDETSNTGSESS